jgi:hypothetical protein
MIIAWTKCFAHYIFSPPPTHPFFEKIFISDQWVGVYKQMYMVRSSQMYITTFSLGPPMYPFFENEDAEYGLV